MKTNELLTVIEDKELLDAIYRFAYHRCHTSHEAEDLCSEIVLKVIVAAKKSPMPENPRAFIWTIARRVYADHCDRCRRTASSVSLEVCDAALAATDDAINRFIDETVEKEQVKRIFAEIAFLSKAYREVMVMYYLEGLSVNRIASRLGIKPTTVKQRLFSARNTVRKEVESMETRHLNLQPKRMWFFGTGNPIGNQPSSAAQRAFSQNLVYLCKDTPKTAKELSEELCVPMFFVEEELEIQCRGENGEYGLLRKLDNGKYTTNVHVVDYKEFLAANAVYERYMPSICEAIKAATEEKKDMILGFPYLSPQTDVRFVLWQLIHHAGWHFVDRIAKEVRETYFADVAAPVRPFSCVALAYDRDEVTNMQFMGHDGIAANAVEGYASIFMSNLYNNEMDAHFHCEHNISLDPQIRLLLRSIGGLDIASLSEQEQEIAAKAIECGYVRKTENGKLEPRVIVVEQKDREAFYRMAKLITDSIEKFIKPIAADVAAFVKEHVPPHLMNEYNIYIQLIACERLPLTVMKYCLQERVLSAPENRVCAEGVFLAVEKA